MEILNYISAVKGSKLGHFQLCIPAWQHLIIDMTLFQKGSQRWVSFPSRKYEKDGKELYAFVIRFKEKETNTRFQEKVLKLLDEFIAKQAQQPPEPQYFQEGLPF